MITDSGKAIAWQVVINKGGVDSYPLMTVYGSGEVEIKCRKPIRRDRDG